MERLVEVTLKKVHILSILNCYHKIFPLIYVSFDLEGIMIQGSCDDQGILATVVIPKENWAMNVESLQL